MHTRIRLTQVGREFSGGPRKVAALEGLDLQVEEGEFVCLVGPSGCGKSTLLDLIAGLQQPSQGEVRVDCGEHGAPRC